MIVATGIMKGNLDKIIGTLQKKYQWRCRYYNKSVKLYTDVEKKIISLKLSDIGNHNILVEASNKGIHNIDEDNIIKSCLFDMFNKVMNLDF